MSQVVIHGNTVYLDGVVARNASGKSMTEQTQDVLKIHRRRSGAGRHRQVEVAPRPPSGSPTWAKFAEMNAVWDGWVSPGNTPARATVEAKLAAPGYLRRDHGGGGEVARAAVGVLGRVRENLDQQRREPEAGLLELLFGDLRGPILIGVVHRRLPGAAACPEKRRRLGALGDRQAIVRFDRARHDLGRPLLRPISAAGCVMLSHPLGGLPARALAYSGSLPSWPDIFMARSTVVLSQNRCRLPAGGTTGGFGAMCADQVSAHGLRNIAPTLLRRLGRRCVWQVLS